MILVPRSVKEGETGFEERDPVEIRESGRRYSDLFTRFGDPSGDSVPLFFVLTVDDILGFQPTSLPVEGVSFPTMCRFYFISERFRTEEKYDGWGWDEESRGVCDHWKMRGKFWDKLKRKRLRTDRPVVTGKNTYGGSVDLGRHMTPSCGTTQRTGQEKCLRRRVLGLLRSFCNWLTELTKIQWNK